MKLLITGSCGQVGSELVLRSKKNGYEFIATDVSELDITSRDAVESMLGQALPDIVINAAAYTAVDQAESNHEIAFLVNKVGPSNLALACSKYSIPLLHISTDYVFDGTKQSAYTELDVPNPTGVYGQSKWEGEEVVRRVLEQHLILRVSWVFSRFGNNFVKTMLRVGKERTELGVVDDQFGCPTYAGDIAETLLALAKQVFSQKKVRDCQWGTYHFCNAPEVSWFQFAETIFSEAKKLNLLDDYPIVKGIQSEAYPTPVERPKNSVLCCDRINSVFGVEQPSWLLGLRDVLGADND